MLLAVELSARRGLVPASEVQALHDLLVAAGLPVQPPADMAPETFIELMGRDKKVVDGRLRLVLLAAMGEACIVDDVSNAELLALLETPPDGA
jgi:3-dehydroquinate synthase